MSTQILLSILIGLVILLGLVIAVNAMIKKNLKEPEATRKWTDPKFHD